MKTLASYYRKDYNLSWQRFVRISSKAIIFSEGEIGIMYSEKYKVYIFSGGGVEDNETATEALIREVDEETGLTIKPLSIVDFGKVLEI